jgi:hypothetical protein
VPCSTTGSTDFLQLSFPGKGRGQMNPDFPSTLYYSSSDFNDFEPYSIELGRGPLGSFQVESPESVEKHIGSRMKKEPKLIGGKTCARSAVREQMVLVLFYHKFHCSPAGVTRLIDKTAVPVFQVGYDKPGIRSKGVVFDFGDDSARLFPGLGFIVSLCEHFNRIFFSLEPQRDLFDKRLDLSDQGGEGLKPQNIFDIVVFTKIKNIRAGVIGISPQKDAHFRPGLPYFFDHPLYDRDDLLACWPLSRPQHGCYQLAAFSFIDVDGHIAVIAVIGIKKSQLLMAMGQIICVIDIQNDTPRRFAVGVDKHIDKHLCDPVKVCPGETIFKSAYGRLAGQSNLIIGQSFTGYFHYRIVPQFIAVVSILITAGNLENALLEKFKHLMFDITGVAAITNNISYFADDPNPVFNFPEEKKSGIGTDLAAIEIGLNFLIGNPFKKEQLCSTIFHGCFLFFMAITYYISIRYEGKQLFL